MPLERERSGGRLHPIASVDVVLDHNRDPVQPTADAPRFALSVALVGDRQRIRVDLDHAVDFGARPVDAFDATQVELDEGAPRKFTIGQFLLKLENRGFFHPIAACSVLSFRRGFRRSLADRRAA
jgi:hypothetical protein